MWAPFFPTEKILEKFCILRDFDFAGEILIFKQMFNFLKEQEIQIIFFVNFNCHCIIFLISICIAGSLVPCVYNKVSRFNFKY